MLTKKSAGKLSFLPKGKLKTAKAPASAPADKKAPPAPVLKPGDSKKLKGMA